MYSLDWYYFSIFNIKPSQLNRLTTFGTPGYLKSEKYKKIPFKVERTSLEQ